MSCDNIFSIIIFFQFLARRQRQFEDVLFLLRTLLSYIIACLYRSTIRLVVWCRGRLRCFPVSLCPLYYLSNNYGDFFFCTIRSYKVIWFESGVRDACILSTHAFAFGNVGWFGFPTARHRTPNSYSSLSLEKLFNDKTKLNQAKNKIVHFFFVQQFSG